MIIQHLFSSGSAMVSTLCYSAGALWPLPASLPRTAPGPGMPWSSDTTGVTWAAHGLRYEFPEFPMGLDFAGARNFCLVRTRIFDFHFQHISLKASVDV